MGFQVLSGLFGLDARGVKVFYIPIKRKQAEEQPGNTPGASAGTIPGASAATTAGTFRMIRIKGVRLREVVRPLRTTFSTSLGQKEHLHSVIVTVTLDGGASGIGEVPTSIAFRGRDRSCHKKGSP